MGGIQSAPARYQPTAFHTNTSKAQMEERKERKRRKKKAEDIPVSPALLRKIRKIRMLFYLQYILYYYIPSTTSVAVAPRTSSTVPYQPSFLPSRKTKNNVSRSPSSKLAPTEPDKNLQEWFYRDNGSPFSSSFLPSLLWEVCTSFVFLFFFSHCPF